MTHMEQVAHMTTTAIRFPAGLYPQSADGLVRIRLLSHPDGTTDGLPVGQFLADYDPDGNDGHGMAVFTEDEAQALAFPNAEVAERVYRLQSTVRPFHPDGYPNRPLTAYTVGLY